MNFLPIIFILMSLTFLILNIVFLVKKKKSKGYGIATLIISIVTPLLSSTASFASADVGSSSMGIAFPLIIVAILSLANIIMACIILPKGGNLQPNEINSKQQSSIESNSSDDNSEKVNRETKQIDFEEAYKHSPRRKIEISGLVCGIICGVMLIVCIGFSFAGFATIMIPFYIIGFICGGVWVWSVFAKRMFCPLCGCKGEEIDCKQTGQSTKVERKLITQNYQRNSANGHYVVDKDGKEYIEQLVTTTTYEKTMLCPNCENSWSVEQKKKS